MWQRRVRVGLKVRVSCENVECDWVHACLGALEQVCVCVWICVLAYAWVCLYALVRMSVSVRAWMSDKDKDRKRETNRERECLLICLFVFDLRMKHMMHLCFWKKTFIFARNLISVIFFRNKGRWRFLTLTWSSGFKILLLAPFFSLPGFRFPQVPSSRVPSVCFSASVIAIRAGTARYCRVNSKSWKGLKVFGLGTSSGFVFNKL